MRGHDTTSDPAAELDRKRACEVLGVGEDSNWDTVRAAYSRLIKQYHPDTGGTGDGDAVSRIIDAYRFLSGGGTGKYPNEGHLSSAFALGQQAVYGGTARERAFACSRLASLGRKSSSAYLQRALFDSEERVAITAAEGLGRIRSLAASESMRVAFGRAGPELRAAIIEAAREIGPYPCFRPLVLDALREPSPRWRATALRLYLAMKPGEGSDHGRSA